MSDRDLRSTLNLPRTDFPMRGNLAGPEPGRYDPCLYQKNYVINPRERRVNPRYCNN